MPLPFAPSQRRVIGSIFVRRECWKLSRRGKLLVLGLLASIIVAVAWKGHSFLAVTDRVPADLLIVEGWLPPHTLDQAAAEFRIGFCSRILIVNPIYEAVDGKAQLDPGSSDYPARLLVKCGVPKSCVDTVVCSAARKDRTYHSALAARAWLQEQGITLKCINVATLGSHARRSRLLYQKAFGKDVRIGVIALEDRAYNSAHWWRYSEGVREVIGEGIAYVYARLFFHPRDTEKKDSQ